VGLFAIVCDGKLAGGFGVRPRTFRQAGPDDFLPADGAPCSGFLVYGVVLRPEVRGQGVYDYVQQELLRWFGAAGFYAITDFPGEKHAPGSVQVVGHSGPYRAYHIRPLSSPAKPAFLLSRQIEYRLRNMRTITEIRQETAQLRQALHEKENASRREIASLHRLLADRHQAFLAREQASRQEIAALQDALTNLQRSRSWRWTAPMRRVISLLRQVGTSDATAAHPRIGDQQQDCQGRPSHRAG
jgi:hypothetical protein